MAKIKRRSVIAGQYIARPRQLVDSPVMAVLSQSAFRALNRIESEHMAHGGAENGKLPVTYADFERCGIHVNAIAPALRELEVLGLIETTRKGYDGAAGLRAPSLYRLTYVAAWNAGRADETGTHEYPEQAEVARDAARNAVNPRNVARGKIHFATLDSCGLPASESEGGMPDSCPRKPRVHGSLRKPRLLSISREGMGQIKPLAKRAFHGAVASERLDDSEPIAAIVYQNNRPVTPTGDAHWGSSDGVGPVHIPCGRGGTSGER
jgi:hypothetical protein